MNIVLNKNKLAYNVEALLSGLAIELLMYKIYSNAK